MIPFISSNRFFDAVTTLLSYTRVLYLVGEAINLTEMISISAVWCSFWVHFATWCRCFPWIVFGRKVSVSHVLYAIEQYYICHKCLFFPVGIWIKKWCSGMQIFDRFLENIWRIFKLCTVRFLFSELFKDLFYFGNI